MPLFRTFLNHFVPGQTANSLENLDFVLSKDLLTVLNCCPKLTWLETCGFSQLNCPVNMNGSSVGGRSTKSGYNKATAPMTPAPPHNSGTASPLPLLLSSINWNLAPNWISLFYSIDKTNFRNDDSGISRYSDLSSSFHTIIRYQKVVKGPSI